MENDDRNRKIGPDLNLDGDYIQELDEINSGFLRRSPDAADDLRRRLWPVRSYPIGGWGGPFSAFTTDHHPISVAAMPPEKLRPPRWLAGTYRPRALSEAGVRALECLAPDGMGLCGYTEDPITSQAMRRDVLASRYAALDMVERGHAFEVGGTYHHSVRKPRLDDLREQAIRSLRQSNQQVDETKLQLWLAVGRVMTMDQIIELDPENAYNNISLLQEFKVNGDVNRQTVALGHGSIEVWFLEKRAWDRLVASCPVLDEWGYGPLRFVSGPANGRIASTCRGLHLLHHLIQFDAIQWFADQVIERSNRVTGIFLERWLKSANENAPGERYLDFQINFEAPDGRMSCFAVEVIGKGHSYRSRDKKKYIQSTPVHRSFSSSAHQINLDYHVSIGR